MTPPRNRASRPSDRSARGGGAARGGGDRRGYRSDGPGGGRSGGDSRGGYGGRGIGGRRSGSDDRSGGYSSDRGDGGYRSGGGGYRGGRDDDGYRGGRGHSRGDRSRDDRRSGGGYRSDNDGYRGGRDDDGYRGGRGRSRDDRSRDDRFSGDDRKSGGGGYRGGRDNDGYRSDRDNSDRDRSDRGRSDHGRSGRGRDGGRDDYGSRDGYRSGRGSRSGKGYKSGQGSRGGYGSGSGSRPGGRGGSGGRSGRGSGPKRYYSGQGAYGTAPGRAPGRRVTQDDFYDEPFEDHPAHTPDGDRLQKVLSGAGVASRRASEELIAAGRVSVDGVVVSMAGLRIDPTKAVVHVDGARVPLDDSKTYLVVNKPRGVVTTMSDPEGRPCVGDLLDQRSRKLFHVGRLDADTEGLLLLTNDGELSHRLQHPSFEVVKTYIAEVPGPVEKGLGKLLRSGVELEDGPVTVDGFAVVDSRPGRALVEVKLHEGRNHIVRRLLAEVGYPVKKLARTHMGPLALGRLTPGKTRVLSRAEISALLTAAGM